MLKQRIITALVLLAVLLPALLYSAPEPFCALTLLLIAGAGWEWARLSGCRAITSIGLGLLLGVVLGGVWWQVGFAVATPTLWLAGGALWVIITVVLLARGVSGWALIPRGVRLWLGLCLIGLAWWAMAQARHLGVGVLLSILALVWTADIAAYFGGRAFGKRKLAPKISPGKSWAGVYSGAVGVFLVALVWVWSEAHWGLSGQSLYGKLWAMGPVAALLSLVFLTAMSVTGDLLESLVKRSAGVKDSSGLLPGHGGILDRVDALLPVLPLAMMFLTW